MNVNKPFSDRHASKKLAQKNSCAHVQCLLNRLHPNKNDILASRVSPSTTRYPNNFKRKVPPKKRKVQKKSTTYKRKVPPTKEKFHHQKESTTHYNTVRNFAILTFQGKGDTICLRPLFIR